MPEREKYRIQLRLIDPQGRAIEGWGEADVDLERIGSSIESEAYGECWAQAPYRLLAEMISAAQAVTYKGEDC